MSQILPPRIYTCAEWGAKPVTQKFPTRPALGICTHHTASPNHIPHWDAERERARCFALARAIQREHQTRKPPYADSGYHFFVTLSGLILEGRHGTLAAARRGRCVRGAHAGTNLANAQYFGVAWEGRNDTHFMVTPTQWAAGVELCAWLAFWGKFDTAENHPHRLFRPTVCPGLLADHLDDLRREAHGLKVKLLAQGA